MACKSGCDRERSSHEFVFAQGTSLFGGPSALEDLNKVSTMAKSILTASITLRIILTAFAVLAAPLVGSNARASTSVAGWLATAAVGQGGSFGTIKGRLVWGGDQVPGPIVLEAKGKAQKDPNVCALNQDVLSHELEVDPKSKGVSYGFAFLVRPKGTNPDAVKDLIAKSPKVEIDQKNCDFLPHSIAILQDQGVVMKSSDDASHNVHLTGFNNAINQTVQPKSKLDVKLVPERLPIRLQCDIHPWMHGHIMVFDHPFFAVTAADGAFEIKGVPAGSQNLVLWQEKVGFVTPGRGQGMPVTVVAGEVKDVGEIKIDPAKVK